MLLKISTLEIQSPLSKALDVGSQMPTTTTLFLHYVHYLTSRWGVWQRASLPLCSSWTSLGCRALDAGRLWPTCVAACTWRWASAKPLATWGRWSGARTTAVPRDSTTIYSTCKIGYPSRVGLMCDSLSILWWVVYCTFGKSHEQQQRQGLLLEIIWDLWRRNLN